MHRDVPLDRIDGLSGQEAGLDQSQIAERRSLYGRNTIIEDGPPPWIAILRRTAADPMIWFLVGTAILFLCLGEYSEAIILAAAIFPIIGMDVFLHRRTEASTRGLLARLASNADVIRDGKETRIPSVELVPGDLVLVQAGGYFPADGLILSGSNLQADESSLTGEALPVRKAALAHPPGGHFPVNEDNWVMAGSRLLTGSARIRIVFTGTETLYGEIASLSRSLSQERTPLQKAVIRLVQFLLVIAVALCILLAGIRIAQGYGPADAVLSAATLGIAALPEEFPVVLSFYLGLGVYRLARRRALVRRAVVVENIGRTTCICTDKTGTLTEGRLALSDTLPAPGVTPARLLAIAATASRIETADPLDLIILQQASAITGRDEKTFPFTEDRRRETSARRIDESRWLFAMKGAPETVLAMSLPDNDGPEYWLRRVDELASSGHKVIGIAEQEIVNWNGIEPETGFRFCGLLAFSDPVRPGVPEAVRQAQEAGIRIIMMTGDHAQTAAAIARAIGIGGDAPVAIDGKDLDARFREGSELTGFEVVARCTPSQKLSLVQTLRKCGERVAVTGDGVNDVPALRGADVGIAMGLRGTEAARDAASIVLLDDDFATIVRAISEGRLLFSNLKSSFVYLLILHAPLVTTAALIPLLGYPLLYLPIHIVWMELIIHPTAMLVFQNEASGPGLTPMDDDRRLRFFSGSEWLRIALAGLLCTLTLLWAYMMAFGADSDVSHARAITMAILATSSSAVTASLTLWRSRAARIAAIAPLLSVLFFSQIEPVAGFLHLAPLRWPDWVIVCLAAILVGACAYWARPATRAAGRNRE